MKERPTDKEGRRKEEDISNSTRHAVFPWQLGFHRNNLAKDAISVGKKKIPTYTLLHCVHKYRNILHLTHQGCVFAATRGGRFRLLTWLRHACVSRRLGSSDAAAPLDG